MSLLPAPTFRAPRLLQASANVCKRTFRVPVPGDEAFTTFATAWNVFVVADRRGKLHDETYRLLLLGKAFGQGLKKRREWPIVEAAFKAYRTRRAKANGPLRFKKPERVKHIPAVGYVLPAVNDVLRSNGINLLNVLSKRIRRSGQAYVVNVTMKVPKLDQVAASRRRSKKHYHLSRIEDVGLSMTPDGLDILVTNNPQKWDAKRVVKSYHVPVKDVLTPGFIQDIYRILLAPLANTVALDESMVPALPGALRSANTELRRWCRSRKAAGAIEFGVVSPVWREVQDTLDYAKSVGFYPEDLRGVLWDVRRNFVLKCPHCGAPVALKLDPHTQVPTEGAVACSECKATVRVGHLLATRASAHIQADWLNGPVRPRGTDHRPVAPLRRTATKTTTNRRGASPHTPSVLASVLDL